MTKLKWEAPVRELDPARYDPRSERFSKYDQRPPRPATTPYVVRPTDAISADLGQTERQIAAAEYALERMASNPIAGEMKDKVAAEVAQSLARLKRKRSRLRLKLKRATAD